MSPPRQTTGIPTPFDDDDDSDKTPVSSDPSVELKYRMKLMRRDMTDLGKEVRDYAERDVSEHEAMRKSLENVTRDVASLRADSQSQNVKLDKLVQSAEEEDETRQARLEDARAARREREERKARREEIESDRSWKFRMKLLVVVAPILTAVAAAITAYYVGKGG